MTTLHEVATLTSKGQITVPKSIRQILGLAEGGKVAFDLRQGQVVVSLAETENHEDPAIAGFLALLERDMQSGRNVSGLPEDLVQTMAAALDAAATDEDITGEVAL